MGHCEFMASLFYIVDSRPARDTDPISNGRGEEEGEKRARLSFLLRFCFLKQLVLSPDPVFGWNTLECSNLKKKTTCMFPSYSECK